MPLGAISCDVCLILIAVKVISIDISIKWLSGAFEKLHDLFPLYITKVALIYCAAHQRSAICDELGESAGCSFLIG